MFVRLVIRSIILHLLTYKGRTEKKGEERI